MIIKRIAGADTIYGAPPDWKDDGMECAGLPVRHVQTDQGVFAVSAWEPSPEEIQAILRGETIKLWIRAPGHPVVALTVGDI